MTLRRWLSLAVAAFATHPIHPRHMAGSEVLVVPPLSRPPSRDPLWRMPAAFLPPLDVPAEPGRSNPNRSKQRAARRARKVTRKT